MGGAASAAPPTWILLQHETCTISTIQPNATITITTNITLTAIWTPNTYTVIFAAGASSGVSGTMANQSFEYDQAQNLTANAYSRTGYNFNGWKDEDSGITYNNRQILSC